MEQCTQGDVGQQRSYVLRRLLCSQPCRRQHIPYAKQCVNAWVLTCQVNGYHWRWPAPDTTFSAPAVVGSHRDSVNLGRDALKLPHRLRNTHCTQICLADGRWAVGPVRQ